jgi:PDZ domain
MRVRPTVLSMVLLTVTAGCGNLEVVLSGGLRSGPVPIGAEADDPAGPVLAFDSLGNLTINGYGLRLPQGREIERFGITLVDAGALPPRWRPTHATDGGLLVASLQRSSPLAVAGLRVFDRVLDLDGVPARELDDVLSPLRSLAHGQSATLTAIRAGDEESFTVQIEAGEKLSDSGVVTVPFLYEQRASNLGFAMGAGPFDSLFYFRSAIDQRYTREPAMGYSRYQDAFEVGVLGSLFVYRSWRDLDSGEERSGVRLLWLLWLGDDE